MAAERLKYVRVSLRNAQEGVTLRLRWDRSPRTCESVCRRLPVEENLWHAKYAHNEIYALVPHWEEGPASEWACAYPGIGDLLYIPHPPGVLPRKDHGDERLVDLAYFYERGNCLYGPGGPAIGNIFATAVSMEEAEAFALVCHRVWHHGIAGERMLIEAVE